MFRNGLSATLIVTALALPAAFGAPVDEHLPGGEPLGTEREQETRQLDVLQLERDIRTRGWIEVELLGQTFELQLSAAPWRIQSHPTTHVNGGATLPPGFHAASYQGVVGGKSPSRAFLTFTTGGLDGYVWTAEQRIEIEPLGARVRGAPSDMVFVYSLGAMRLPAAPGTGGLGPLSHRVLDVWGDYEFNQLYPGPCGSSYCWADKIHDVVGRLNDLYDGSVGFTFSYRIQTVCAVDYCNENIGATEGAFADELLDEWASNMYNRWSGGYSGWDVLQLFTGKEALCVVQGDGCPVVGGIAYQSGRYALTVMTDFGYYNPEGSGSNSHYEAASTAAHETGHNFNGDHDEADVYPHCDIYIGFCWPVGHQSTHGTIMSGIDHEPNEGLERDAGFSDSNEERIADCDQRFDDLGRTPVWDPGLGAGHPCII